MAGDLDAALSRFDGISLKALDERAALLRRIDNKYAVGSEQLVELLGRLRCDHQVLEIDDQRVFGYSTVYFETPDLRCFVDHVEDRIPRFKARTRVYEDSGDCVFEVKLKRTEDETDKRQLHYSAGDRDHLTDEARSCLESALEDAGVAVPDELEASLISSFDRVTFAARRGSERLTCDLGVRLVSPDGPRAVMKGDLVLVETKSEDGESPADRLLTEMGEEPISLSKYRVGMSLVGAASGFGDQPGRELFELEPR